MRSNIYAIIVATLIVFTLSACSDVPSEGVVEEQLVEKMSKDGSNDLFEIDDVEKVNGMQDGETKYVVDVRYNLVAKQSLKDYVAEQVRKSGNTRRAKMEAGMAESMLKSAYGDFKPGDELPQEKKLVFRKTEKGWVLR